MSLGLRAHAAKITTMRRRTRLMIIKRSTTPWKFFAISAGVVLGIGGGMALAARNSSGTYSLPYSAFVPGTTISAPIMNSTLSDLATEMSDSLSRSGKGGMTAPFRGPDGTAASPSLSFSSETASGLYRVGAQNVGLSAGGTLRFNCNGSTACTVSDPLVVAGSETNSGGDYLMTLAGTQALTKTGGTLAVGTGDSNALYLKTNATNQWQMDISGNITPSSTTQGFSPNTVTVTQGDITLSKSGTQQLVKSGGQLNVGTSDTSTATFMWSGSPVMTASSANPVFAGKPTATATVVGDGSTTLVTKGYVDNSTDIRTYLGGDVSCTTTGSGASLFSFSYSATPRVHFQGTLYVLSASANAFTIQCSPSTSINSEYMDIAGGSASGWVNTLQQVANGGTNTISIALSPSSSDITLLFRGGMMAYAATAGTYTCYCKISGGTTTIKTGSNFGYHADL